MKYLFLILFSLPAIGATYDFELMPTGNFRKLTLKGVTIEAGFQDVAFVGDEPGRPQHFKTKSVYTSGTLTITFDPIVSGATVSGAVYPKGQASWQCYLFDTVTGTTHPYPMGDTTAEIMIYPQFDNLSGMPMKRYKVTKCLVKGIGGGIWIDALGTQP